MAETRTRLSVRNALDDLKRYLAVFILDVRGASPIPGPSLGGSRAGSSRRGLVAVHDADIAALLGVMLDEWHVFSSRLSPMVRNYVRELKEVRNQWAHERAFSEEEASRAHDTIRMLARAIGHPGASSLASPPRVPETRAEGAPAAPNRPSFSTGASAAPVLDASGVILNASELSADELAGKRVLCPACRRKVFAMWPGGWDAHSGSLRACAADLGDSEEARKAEFKRRYRAQFR